MRLPPELRRVVEDDELDEDREELDREELRDDDRLGVEVRRGVVLAAVDGAGVGVVDEASAVSGNSAGSADDALGSPNSGATDARLSKTISGPSEASPTSVAKLTVSPCGGGGFSSSFTGIGKLAT